MKENRCIICGEKKNGLPVKEDNIITLIRWFKKNVTKNEKGYRLVVCKEDYPKYYKHRKKFENRRAMYLALGIVFAVFMMLVSTNKLLAVLYSVIVILFFYLLAYLTYIPELDLGTKRPLPPRSK